MYSAIRGTSEIDTAVGDPDGGSAAIERDHQVFGQQLPHDAAARSADGHAHAELAPAVGRAREQHVRDVGARDEEHERHRGPQHEHRRPRVAEEAFELGLDVGGGKVLVRVRILRRQPGGDGVELRVRLLERHARWQAGDRVQQSRPALLGDGLRGSPTKRRARAWSRSARAAAGWDT